MADQTDDASDKELQRADENEDSSDKEDEMSVHEMAELAAIYGESANLGVFLDEMQGDTDIEDDEEDENEEGYKGSIAGRRVIERDFTSAYERLMEQYFSGASSMYTDVHFSRRFRVSRQIFQRVFESVLNRGEFRSHLSRNAAGKFGIHPIVRLTACFRALGYGDAADREDENLQIAASTLDASLNSFCELLIELFGNQYLNRSPTEDEKRKIFAYNKKRGFPGLFASWDCKHFVWDMCPMALQGQHKGHHGGGKNTVILEAVADGSCYFWYINFGDPGSLNDINVLNRSSIVASILNGTLNIKTDAYEVNGNKRDWMYFLADGIYPDWSIFVKTIPEPARTDTNKVFFASRQEAVRKDVERAFGILVKKFQILARPIRKRNPITIRNILYSCVILHNMCCEERWNATGTMGGMVQDADHDNFIDGAVLDENESFFGRFTFNAPNNNTNNNAEVDLQQIMNNRFAQVMRVSDNMTSAIRHQELQRDLVAHLASLAE